MIFILKNLIKTRWHLCCLLFFITSCHSGNNYNSFSVYRNDSVNQERLAVAAMDSIYLYKNIIKSGDLVLRTGKDFTSETMRRLSLNDKTYSHCGIASIEHDSIFVYHAIGGEFNPDQKLRRDLVEVFCNPYESRGFGIFRYKFTPYENARLIKFADSVYKKGVKFDMLFNLANNDRLYCSEFVYKAVKEASNNTINLNTTTLNHINFIAIDNLFFNSNCIEIKRIKFKQ